MALKKIPPGMNYASIRHRHPPSSGTMPTRQSLEEADTRGPSSHSDAAAKEERRISRTDEAPTSVEMPIKAAPRQTPAGARQLKQPTTPERTAKQKAATGQNVRFRGYVRTPAAGEHAIYDELVTIYGRQKALGLCLSMGMTAYSAALETTDLPAVMAPSKRRGGRVETSRSMPDDLYAKAVAHLDPKGLLGKSQIGSRILDAALEHYLRTT